jgi:putative endonuclease
MMAVHNDTGARGELLAQQYLVQMGYRILDINWRCSRAEVDLIALVGSTLVFVEVKTRTGHLYGQPEDFVDSAKQSLLTYAAEEYLYKINHNEDIRFDIISILFDKFGNHTLNHIEDAFWPGS